MSKRPKGRHSPGQSLEQTEDFLGRVHQRLGDGPFDRQQLAAALGHSSLSGPAQRKVGSLVHFGLLEGRGASYQISALGRSLLFPTTDSERDAAVATACQSPRLYGELFERFAGKKLPSLLDNILLRDFGVAANTAGAVATRFRQSAEYAGLVTDGRIGATHGASEEHPISHAAPQDNSQVELPNEEIAPGQGDAASQATAPFASGECFAIPLSHRQRAVIELPRSLQSSDVDLILRWIDLMRDVLVGGASKDIESTVESGQTPRPTSDEG